MSLPGHVTSSPPPLCPPSTRPFPFPPSPVRLHLGLNRKHIAVTGTISGAGNKCESGSYLPGVWRRSRGTGCSSYRTHRSSPAAPHSQEPHSPGAGNTNRLVSRGRRFISSCDLSYRTVTSQLVTHPAVQPVLTHHTLNHLILHLHTNRFTEGTL